MAVQTGAVNLGDQALRASPAPVSTAAAAKGQLEQPSTDPLGASCADALSQSRLVEWPRSPDTSCQIGLPLTSNPLLASGWQESLRGAPFPLCLFLARGLLSDYGAVDPQSDNRPR
jgi:hypothetical protein